MDYDEQLYQNITCRTHGIFQFLVNMIRSVVGYRGMNFE